MGWSLNLSKVLTDFFSKTAAISQKLHNGDLRGPGVFSVGPKSSVEQWSKPWSNKCARSLKHNGIADRVWSSHVCIFKYSISLSRLYSIVKQCLIEETVNVFQVNESWPHKWWSPFWVKISQPLVLRDFISFLPSFVFPPLLRQDVQVSLLLYNEEDGYRSLCSSSSGSFRKSFQLSYSPCCSQSQSVRPAPGWPTNPARSL